MSGLIVVDKPIGYTSRDVVNIVSKVLRKRKVGHTGTLDPLATGVLLLMCWQIYEISRYAYYGK